MLALLFQQQQSALLLALSYAAAGLSLSMLRIT